MSTRAISGQVQTRAISGQVQTRAFGPSDYFHPQTWAEGAPVLKARVDIKKSSSSKKKLILYF